jgi:hypothetical protein
MTAADLRRKYLEFFQSKGHAVISGKSLIPENDPTVLFNTAGMQPLVPYLLGEKHPLGNRLADVQKCVRTGDIDEVGDDTHLTFFEMLGNFSFGDYFKVEAIRYSWEFLTSSEWLGLDPERLSFTVFEDDDEGGAAAPAPAAPARPAPAIQLRTTAATRSLAVSKPMLSRTARRTKAQSFGHTSMWSLRAAGAGVMFKSALHTVCEGMLRGNKCAMCCAVSTCGA